VSSWVIRNITNSTSLLNVTHSYASSTYNSLSVCQFVSHLKEMSRTHESYISSTHTSQLSEFVGEFVGEFVSHQNETSQPQSVIHIIYTHTSQLHGVIACVSGFVGEFVSDLNVTATHCNTHFGQLNRVASNVGEFVAEFVGYPNVTNSCKAREFKSRV